MMVGGVAGRLREYQRVTVHRVPDLGQDWPLSGVRLRDGLPAQRVLVRDINPGVVVVSVSDLLRRDAGNSRRSAGDFDPVLAVEDGEKNAPFGGDVGDDIAPAVENVGGACEQCARRISEL